MQSPVFNRLRYLLSFGLLLLGAGATFGQGTAFTYQGRLQDGGSLANGSYDLQFTLWDAAGSGTQQPQPSPVTVTRTSISVANGIFTTQLDFGASAFPGADRWLEISVRLAGGGPFTLLSPRQPISSTPYAVRSASAANADTANTATNANNATNAVNATNATTAANATQLGGVAAGNYVQTNDARLTDARAPTAGSSSYIQNTSAPQTSSNFNISGGGTVGGTLSANTVNAATQFNLNGNRVLSVPGTDNTFAGVGAGAGNSAGISNSFFGRSAGNKNTTGNFNAFFGVGSGFSNVGGHENSSFGFQSGNSFTTGSDNAFFGFRAGLSSTGSNNTLIGANSNVGVAGVSNATAVGANTTVSASNTVILGNNASVGIGTSAPDLAKLEIVTDGSLDTLRLRNTWAINPRSYRIGPGAGSKFFGIYDDNAAATRLTIDNSGNVGIGTTNPTDLLTVYGNSTIGKGQSSASTATAVVYDESSGLVGFQKRGTAQSGLMGLGNNASEIVSTSGNFGVMTSNAADLVLGTNGSERLRINAGGNVGIGTNNPNARLEINSGSSDGLTTRSDGGYFALFADGDVKQTRENGGLVKAMANVSSEGNVTRCFCPENQNKPSLGPPCNFVVTQPAFGQYLIDFGFKVDDRFILASGAGEIEVFDTNCSTCVLINVKANGAQAKGHFFVFVF